MRGHVRSRVTTPSARAVSAIDRAIYLLDRSLAAPQKVRAFQGARRSVGALTDAELLTRCQADTLRDLPGIGASTASVIAPAVLGTPPEYLNALEESTRIEASIGAGLRAQLRGDCHVHTTWSDGATSIDHMASAAEELGHRYLVITDHSPRLTIAHGCTPERYEAQRREIEERNAARVGFDIMWGCEVDIWEDGALDLPSDLLGRFDFVVASVHSKLAQPSEEMTKRLLAAVTHEHVDALGHCTGRILQGRERAQSQFDAELVFAACAQFGTAIEINCRPERQDPPPELVALALELGCSFVINSDAHAPGQLEWLTYGAIKAIECEIPPERILNTRPAEEIRAWSN